MSGGAARDRPPTGGGTPLTAEDFASCPNSAAVRHWISEQRNRFETAFDRFDRPSLDEISDKVARRPAATAIGPVVLRGERTFYERDGTAYVFDETLGATWPLLPSDAGAGPPARQQAFYPSPQGTHVVFEHGAAGSIATEFRLWRVEAEKAATPLGVIARVCNGGVAWLTEKTLYVAKGMPPEAAVDPAGLGVADPSAPQRLDEITLGPDGPVHRPVPDSERAFAGCHVAPFVPNGRSVLLVFAFSGTPSPHIHVCRDPGTGAFSTAVDGTEPGISLVDVTDEAVWLVRPREDGGRALVSRSIDAPHETRNLIPELPGLRGEVVADLTGGLFVVEDGGTQDSLHHLDAGGASLEPVRIFEGKAIQGVTVAAAGRSFVRLSGWDHPTHFEALAGTLPAPLRDLGDDEQRPTIHRQVLQATARDGTQIPVTLLTGSLVAEPRPTIVYVYGGFGLSLRPRHLGALLEWLDRGGRLAFAHVRGGGELGSGWHQCATGPAKSLTVSDTIDVAGMLTGSGVAAPGQLGLYGHSHGGFVSLAALVHEERAFDAIVAVNPLTDLTRFDTGSPGHLWRSEFVGECPSGTDHLRALSPLHAVVKGRDYPPALVIVSARDDIVPPWHGLAFVHRLDEATDHKGVVLLSYSEAGYHKNVYGDDKERETCLVLCFFANRLGAERTP